MVFAKTSKAAKRISEAISSHQVKKVYIAYVKGIIPNDGEINIKIKKVNNLALISPDGKDSLLKYQVLNYYQNNTYVMVDLITGRYNQIRASFAHINHPLVNDHKYDKNIKPNNNELGLWCYQISLHHPVTKEHLTFTIKPQGSIWEGLKIKK
jgi:23S rRNA pseudouridine1911/1915/1917 synthase